MVWSFKQHDEEPDKNAKEKKKMMKIGKQFSPFHDPSVMLFRDVLVRRSDENCISVYDLGLCTLGFKMIHGSFLPSRCTAELFQVCHDEIL